MNSRASVRSYRASGSGPIPRRAIATNLEARLVQLHPESVEFDWHERPDLRQTVRPHEARDP